MIFFKCSHSILLFLNLCPAPNCTFGQIFFLPCMSDRTVFVEFHHVTIASNVKLGLFTTFLSSRVLLKTHRILHFVILCLTFLKNAHDYTNVSHNIAPEGIFLRVELRKLDGTPTTRIYKDLGCFYRVGLGQFNMTLTRQIIDCQRPRFRHKSEKLCPISPFQWYI